MPKIIPRILLIVVSTLVLGCALRGQNQIDVLPDGSGVGEVRFIESTGWGGIAATQGISLKASASIATNFDWIFPNANPGATNCLEVTTGGQIQYAAGACGTAGAGTFYQTMEDNGVAETQRPVLNFVSAALVLTDDAGGNETDFTITSSPANSATFVGTGRLINTTSPILGGGDLSADRTISCTTCITAGSQTIAGTKTFTNSVTMNTGTNMTTISMSGGIEMFGTGLDYFIDRSSAEGFIFGRTGGDDIIEIEEISTSLNELRLQAGSGAADDVLFRLVNSTAGNGFQLRWDQSPDDELQFELHNNTLLMTLNASALVMNVELQLDSNALASLGTPANGTMKYCADCLKGSDPCTASSSGAFALRVNGAWQCP